MKVERIGLAVILIVITSNVASAANMVLARALNGGGYDIQTCDADGSNLSTIWTAPAGDEIRGLAGMTNGKVAVSVYSSTGAPQIIVMNNDGSSPQAAWSGQQGQDIYGIGQITDGRLAFCFYTSTGTPSVQLLNNDSTISTVWGGAAGHQIKDVDGTSNGDVVFVFNAADGAPSLMISDLSGNKSNIWAGNSTHAMRGVTGMNDGRVAVNFESATDALSVQAMDQDGNNRVSIFSDAFDNRIYGLGQLENSRLITMYNRTNLDDNALLYTLELDASAKSKVFNLSTIDHFVDADRLYVPEPATMSLLGSGALIILTRRKR